MPEPAARAVTGLSRADTIDIWLAYYHEWDDEAALASAHALLSDEEQQRRARFHFADDRLRYLVTRAMVRSVLSHYADVAPTAWRFAVNAYGRPEVAAEHALAFNVSHTHGLIALGVSRQGVLGVDVESLLRPARPELAENLFAPAEHEDLQRLPPEQRGLRFYEYWTLKEAYIKARGMGLSLPLDKFAFGFPGAGRMSLKIDAALADDPDKWRLWQFRLGDFLLAICAESRQCARPRLAWRRLTSLQGFEALHPAPWRYSDGLESSAGTTRF